MEDLEYIQNRLLELINEIEDFRDTEAIRALSLNTIKDNLKSAIRTIDLVKYALEGRN